MLRNELIVLLSQHDNDAVTVNVDGVLIDVEAVTVDRGSIVLELDQEDVHSVVRRGPSGA